MRRRNEQQLLMLGDKNRIARNVKCVIFNIRFQFCDCKSQRSDLWSMTKRTIADSDEDMVLHIFSDTWKMHFHWNAGLL